MTSVRTGNAEVQETLAACLQISGGCGPDRSTAIRRDVFEPPKQELTKAANPLDLAEHGFHDVFPRRIRRAAGRRADFFAIAVFGFSSAVPLQAAGVEEVSAEPLGTSLTERAPTHDVCPGPRQSTDRARVRDTLRVRGAESTRCPRCWGSAGAGPARPASLDARGGKVGHGRLGHGYCLLLVVRGGRDFRRTRIWCSASTVASAL